MKRVSLVVVGSALLALLYFALSGGGEERTLGGPIAVVGQASDAKAGKGGAAEAEGRPLPAGASSVDGDPAGGTNKKMQAVERLPTGSSGLLGRADPSWARAQAQSSTTASRFPITRSGIQGAVRAALPEMKECYEGWLKQNPKIAGRLSIEFLIVPDQEQPEIGRVEKVRLIESEMGHVFMESCVLDVFSDLTFDKPDGETRVTYPVVFANNSEPQP